ncbi:MAG TPA: CHAP domain-containing protein [Coprothermobacter proteolyticus]|nr:CHAP domain-containing protein [Coprothermobacter proteolyticus]
MTTRIRTNPNTLIAFAQSQIGYSERPFGSNNTKYGAWYGMNGVPWCAIFDSYASYHSGNPLPAVRTSKGYAYVPDLQAYAQRTGQYRTRGSGYSPKPGDRVLFNFGGRRVDHVAIVKQNLGGGRILTIEGNTNAAGSRTGGSVLEKVRVSGIAGYVDTDVISVPGNVDGGSLRRLIAAKVREQYGATPNMGGGHPNCCEVVALQQALNIVTGANLATDGKYGDSTIQAVLNFQRFMNAVGANIKDFPGASQEGTRWWLCAALQNIRDGKTP